MTGGMMVRLIDVVLIILFGFLAISDIQMKRQIRLPEPKNEQSETPPDQSTYIFIRISPMGEFDVEVEDMTTEHFVTPSELRTGLQAIVKILYEMEKNPLVIIDPHPEASMQATVDVFDVCEEEGLPRSINMQVSGW